MTNPYNHPGYEHPTEHQAQERELAFILWQKQELENERRAMRMADPNIRRRAKMQLALRIFLGLAGIACLLVWRWLYLNYLWH